VYRAVILIKCVRRIQNISPALNTMVLILFLFYTTTTTLSIIVSFLTVEIRLLANHSVHPIIYFHDISLSVRLLRKQLKTKELENEKLSIP
jgi:hypothetical protein